MKLPSEIYAQHIAVLGKTGAGKSSVLRVMVETLLDEKKPVCIVDPKGDWYGLRLSKSGKSGGYPVVIFGGEHGDVPLNAHSGAHVAELIATGNRPCIIDLGGWMVSDRTRFFIDFASTLFRTTRGARFVVIDEVHNFAPQGKVLDPEAGKMLHWANRLASEGRGKGLTIMSASQRPQKVHKDFLTCAETLIAMRVIHKLDRDAIKDWIDGAGNPAKGKEVLDTLASMKRGEAWVWSPEIGYGPKRVTFPMFTTYDSFAPKANSGDVKLKGWASVNLEEEKAKLAAVIEEKKSNDPAELKKEIARLKRERDSKAPVVDEKATERAVAERDRHWKAEIAKAEKAHSSLAKRLRSVKPLAESLIQLSTLNGDATIAVNAPPQLAKVADISVHKTRTISQSVPQHARKQGAAIGDIHLSKAERAILIAMYWLRDEVATPAKVAFYSNYSSGSGGFNNALGKLRSAGLISGWSITAAGISMAETLGASAKPSGDKLREWLRKKLGKAENALLDALCEAHPNRLTHEQLSEASGYSAGSGGFNNAIGRLRSIEAAEGYERDGGPKAADVFFE